MTGGGKKLTVGKSHALTATIMNSEIMKAFLVDSLNEVILFSQDVGTTKSYFYGATYWLSNSLPYHYISNMLASKSSTFLNFDFELCRGIASSKNQYDSSLVWMAGATDIDIEITNVSQNNDEITYRVNVLVRDNFDFDTSNGEGFKDLISGIGALLFKEYYWESSVTFDITVPVVTSCNHQSNSYKFTYDPKGKNMVSISDNATTFNEITKRKSENNNYFYELDEMIHLEADMPWVLEYDARNVNPLMLSVVNETSTKTYPIFYHNNNSIYIRKHEIVGAEKDGYYIYDILFKLSYDNYGTKVNDIVTKDTTLTYRYENIIDESGNNMMYLSIYNTLTSELLLDKVAMNDYYRQEYNASEVLKDTSSKYLNGKDLYIKYIGNSKTPLIADAFELRVYEQGKDVEAVSYLTKKKTVKQTCSAQGYTEYTCSKCGRVVKKDYTSKLDHKYTSKVTAATCTEQGYTTYTCSSCKESYKDNYVSKLGHSFTKYVSNQDATLFEDGTKTATCDRCSETNTIRDVGSMLKVVSLAIINKPTKLEYTEGEELDVSDMEVVAYLNNGTSMVITDYEVSGYDKEFVGSQVVHVSYMGYSDSFIVVVNEMVKNIHSSVYTVSEGFIHKIQENTTVGELLDGLDDKELIKVYKDEVEMSNDTIVSTGMVVRLINRGNTMDEVVVVVTGDVNLDGKITITDMLGVKGHILEKNTYEGYVLLAGDTSKDDKVTITDFIQIKSHVLGKSIIEVK